MLDYLEFLSLAIGIPIDIEELVGYLDKNGSEKKIEIITTQRKGFSTEKIHPLKMNFQLIDIQNDFKKILTICFKMCETNLSREIEEARIKPRF